MSELPPAPARPRLGLALGSGAAKGWAHVGVLRALGEMGVSADIYAGCSVGTIVAAGELLGIWDELLTFAKEAGPMVAMKRFHLAVGRGGLISAEPAFGQFRDRDQPIEALSKPFGAVATDLATGNEVWLTRGSTLDACRASSAVPLILQAARTEIDGEERWLIDGGASNPVPVSLARALGAERVIAVDLNGTAQTIARFRRPSTRAVVPVEPPRQERSLAGMVDSFVQNQTRAITQRLALARAKAMAQPQFFETAVATIEIVQTQLARARARVDVAEVRIAPDLTFANAAQFDAWEQFEEAGYQAAVEQREQILAVAGAELASPPSAQA